jgi:hypothetical protein
VGVFGFKSHRHRERFYLLPGQGGRNFRRKQLRFILSAVVVSVVFGLVIAAVMWWQAQPHR